MYRSDFLKFIYELVLMINNLVGSSCVISMLLCDDDKTARGEQRVGFWLTKLLLPIR